MAADWEYSRFDHSERLAAAHSVLVITSFYRGLDTVVDFERLDMNRGEMAIQATGGTPPQSYVELISSLVQAKLPLPEPHRSYVEVRQEIIDIHHSMAVNLRNFARGTAGWDELDETRQKELIKQINRTADIGISNYDKEFNRLAIDNREFAIWASLTETHALGTGLATLTELLNAMTVRSPGGRPRAHLMAITVQRLTSHFLQMTERQKVLSCLD